MAPAHNQHTLRFANRELVHTPLQNRRLTTSQSTSVSFGGGVGTAIPKTFEETTLEEMSRVIDINVRGILATTQEALKHKRRGGRIISIGIGRGRACPGSGARSLLGRVLSVSLHDNAWP